MVIKKYTRLRLAHQFGVINVIDIYNRWRSYEKDREIYAIMTNELLLYKENEKIKTHRTNGIFAFAPTHLIKPSVKSKEPFFATLPDNVL